MKIVKVLMGSGAVALLAMAAFTGVASAQTPQPQQPTQTGPHPVRLLGQVGTISSSTFVLTTRQGDVTVNVGPNTWIVVEKNGASTQGTLADLQTAKPATVAGMTTNDPKVVDAREVVQARIAAPGRQAAPKQAPAGRIKELLTNFAASGTIKAINGSTLTVTTQRGVDVTVNTTANTVVLNNGFQTVSSLKVNDKVGILGRPEKPAQQPTPGSTPANRQRTLTAWAVRVDNPGTKLIVAHVDSVNGNTLTVKTPANRLGTVTITLDNTTGYRSLSVSNGAPTLSTATQADIKAGSNIAVDGVASADGKSLAAKALIILPEGKNKTTTP
jgi:hypothetical protein